MSSRQRDTFNEINITPLTDIFLVLLIIMMVIAPLLDEQGLNLTVPENVEAEQMHKDTKILTVAVTADGQYIINDEEIAADELGDTIKASLEEYPDGLMIQSDGDATHGSVVKLMDEARNAGVKNISVSQM